MKGFIRDLLITLGLAIAIFLILHSVIQNSQVYDISMQPTLYDGQRLIVIKTFFEPQRGDIIIIHPPHEPDKEYVKRLIGMPGDTIEIENGVVYINDVALNEPYIKEAPEYTYSRYSIPEDHYFVLGDNRNNSTDSHKGWTVTSADIVGKVWLRYWPFSKFGFMGSYPLDDQLDSVTATMALPR